MINSKLTEEEYLTVTDETITNDVVDMELLDIVASFTNVAEFAATHVIVPLIFQLF